MLVKKVQKTELFFFLLTIIIFWPNYFINNTIANKRVSTISLASLFLVLLIILLLRYKIKNHILNANWFLTLLFVYILMNIYINQIYLIGGVSIRDFAEIGKISGVFLFFYVGNILSSNVDIKYLFKFACNISYIYMVIIISRFLNITIINKIYFLFYHQNVARFGGTWSGLNYIWIVPLLLIIINLVILEKCAIKFKVFFSLIISVFVIIATIALSGSRTSLVVIIVSLITAILLQWYYLRRINIKKNMGLKLNRRKKIYVLLLLIFVFILIYNVNIYLNKFVINKYSELKYIFSGQITEIKSFNARYNWWKEVYKNEILPHFIIGQGSAKSMITITDNSFLMSLYRYGIIGLLLEFAIYISLFLKYIKYIKEEDSEIYLIPIILLFAYLISCIPANSFYELKLPYFLFFIFGFFNNKVLLKYQKI